MTVFSTFPRGIPHTLKQGVRDRRTGFGLCPLTCCIVLPLAIVEVQRFAMPCLNIYNP
jgi:hypothetical protein